MLLWLLLIINCCGFIIYNSLEDFFVISYYCLLFYCYCYSEGLLFEYCYCLYALNLIDYHIDLYCYSIFLLYISFYYKPFIIEDLLFNSFYSVIICCFSWLIVVYLDCNYESFIMIVCFNLFNSYFICSFYYLIVLF